MRFLLPLLFIAATASAQFPNPGFENWTNGNPDLWNPNNVFVPTISSSPNAHSGLHAMKGDVMSAVIGTVTETIAPYVSAGYGGIGFAMSSGRPLSVQGFYQFTPVGGDVFSVTIILHSGGLTGTLVGGGGESFANVASSYTQLSIPISYFSVATPDYCQATFSIGNDDVPHVGSSFLLDDLVFSASGETAVRNEAEVPASFELKQNFPNPFNPSTMISFALPAAGHVKLSVLDYLGREAAVLVDEYRASGRYNVPFAADHLASGVYFYRLCSGNKTYQRTFLLAK
jgi:hypothetical protein